MGSHPLFTLQGAAERLGCDEATVRGLITAGEIPVILGWRWLIDEKDLQRYADRQKPRKRRGRDRIERMEEG